MNWRRPAFLLAHDLLGSGLRANYREFLAAEHWPAERLEALHADRLGALLRHAVREVPYYRERVAAAELSAFPVLRKEAVHAHFEELMEPSLRAEYRGEKEKMRPLEAVMACAGTVTDENRAIFRRATQGSSPPRGFNAGRVE